MNLTKNIGALLLAVWLIFTGLIELFALSFANLGLLMAILALGAGVVILLESTNLIKGRRSSRKIGWILLGAWLLLTGLVSLVDLAFEGLALLLGLLALAAGILILLDR